MDRNLSEFRLTALTGRKEKGMDGGSHFSAHVAQFQSKGCSFVSFCHVLSCWEKKNSLCEGPNCKATNSS